MEVAQELAKTHNFSSGKWLTSVPWDQVDKFWNLLKRAFIQEELGAQAKYIKVNLPWRPANYLDVEKL